MRSSGILLHPTSLPSPYGIGDLGRDAYAFIDFLQATDQTYWQILPLGPTGYGNSPYMCFSAIAGNPLLISPTELVAAGFCHGTDLDSSPGFRSDRVDFNAVIAWKTTLYHRAHDRFQHSATPEQQAEFKQFCQERVHWLEDYALFMALHDHQPELSWYEWAPDLARREPQALIHHQEQLKTEIQYHQFLQFCFFTQWSKLREYAHDRGIQIIGDIPIYVAHNSADVWANQDLFQLDPKTGAAALMAGVPPDYFSETGQLWGNPVYDWERSSDTNFNWWIQRFESLLKLVDIIRVDHFRGFQAFWAVEQGEETAINGRWIQAPGHELFKTLLKKWGKLPILAEDLGVITPDVEALRDGFNFPGMKVLQFAFGSDRNNPFLPYNYGRNFVVYTGTHDNDTTVGWFDKLGDRERDRVSQYLGIVDRSQIHWQLINLAMGSIADTAIIPLQDLFGLGTDARMNFPGIAEGNWEWRYQSHALDEHLQQRLKSVTDIYGRSPL
jgi:4-alpha-glucanotransferase